MSPPGRVSRPTVYKEFGNKEGLGDAMAIKESERFLKGIHAVLDDNAGYAVVAAVSPDTSTVPNRCCPEHRRGPATTKSATAPRASTPVRSSARCTPGAALRIILAFLE